MTTNVATSTYRAPELWLGIAEYSYAIDVWSAGVVFYQLLWLSMPWSEHDAPRDALEAIFAELGSPRELAGWREAFPGEPLPEHDGQDPLVPLRCSVAALAFLEDLLDYNKLTRVTAEEAAEHEFFGE